MSKQPRDDSNYPIPVLGYKPNGGQAIALSAIPARSSAFGTHTRVISIYATGDAYFEIGGPTVEASTANSHFIPSGLYIDISLGAETVSSANAKYLSVISNSSGTLYISERV